MKRFTKFISHTCFITKKLKDKLVNKLRENAEIQETMTPTRDHPRGVPGWAVTLQMKTDWSGDSRRSSPVKQSKYKLSFRK